MAPCVPLSLHPLLGGQCNRVGREPRLPMGRNPPSVLMVRAKEAVHEARLPRAVGSEQKEDTARLDNKIEAGPVGSWDLQTEGHVGLSRNTRPTDSNHFGNITQDVVAKSAHCNGLRTPTADTCRQRFVDTVLTRPWNAKGLPFGRLLRDCIL